MIEAGGWFKRFQDTEEFDKGYASNHSIWCPESDDVIRDPEVESAGLYAGEEGFRLREGLVFCFDSNAETDEEFKAEAKRSQGQVCDDTFCVFFDTEWSFRCEGEDGVIIDLNKSEITKIIRR